MTFVFLKFATDFNGKFANIRIVLFNFLCLDPCLLARVSVCEKRKQHTQYIVSHRCVIQAPWTDRWRPKDRPLNFRRTQQSRVNDAQAVRIYDKWKTIWPLFLNWVAKKRISTPSERILLSKYKTIVMSSELCLGH